MEFYSFSITKFLRLKNVGNVKGEDFQDKDFMPDLKDRVRQSGVPKDQNFDP